MPNVSPDGAQHPRAGVLPRSAQGCAERRTRPLRRSDMMRRWPPRTARPVRHSTRSSTFKPTSASLASSGLASALAVPSADVRQLAHMIRKLHRGLLRTSQHSRGCRTECLESVARALSGECGSVCVHSVSEPVLSGDREGRLADRSARGGCGERARGVTARQVPSAPTSAGRPTTLSNHDSGGSKVPKGTPGDV
jgi:hypothetical protein